MPATIVRGYTFGATETVTNTKLHNLVDLATISGIVAAELASGSVTGPKIAMGSDAQGDILYRNATEYTRLGAGTNGQTLTTGGASANPAWAGMTTRGDIEYMGATTRTRLAVGTVNQVVRSDGTDPAWIGVSGLLDNVFSSTQGAVLYRGASAWLALAPGTVDQVLTSGGAAANPSWTSVTTPAWVFVETLTFSGTSVTSATLPTTSDQFMVVFDSVAVASGTNVTLQFNSDGSAVYSYQNLATATLGSATGQTSILVMTDVSGAGDLTGTFTFSRVVGAGATGHGVAFNIASNVIGDTLALRGQWENSAAITTFTLTYNASTVGKVHVYRLSKS